MPHARVSGVSRCLEDRVFPQAWPYTEADLQPEDPFDDQLFYLLPKFVHHAGEGISAITVRKRIHLILFLFRMSKFPAALLQVYSTV